MVLSPRGKQLLKNREGCRLKAYRDTVGIWTIGYGWTGLLGGRSIQDGMTITREVAEDLFARGVAWYEKAVSAAVTVPLKDHEFDALLSFCYNVGANGFRRSATLRYLNQGKQKQAATAMMLWVRPPELVGRRIAERNQFLTPYTA